MTFSYPGGGTVSIKKVLQTIVYPFEYVFSKIWDFITDVFNSITKIRQYRDKLEETQKILQHQSKSYQAVEELRNQIKVLKQALGLKDLITENYDPNPITARVITRDPNNGYLTLIINKGTSAGIKKDMIVVGYYKGKAGVIGRIIETTPFTAKIMPVHDKASNIGAAVSKNRVIGVIEGQGAKKPLRMSFVPTGTNVAAGDLIVTASESDIFPQGLVIGTVKSAKDLQGQFHKSILVKPFINYSQIEIVFIIKKTPNEHVRRLEGNSR
jgi:rod shape-determining protein MreC